jgi:16S rRNA (uracil1498-N3)-methyltransferase
MNIILFERSEISTGGTTELADVRAKHLIQVLKVGVGSEVRVGVVDGPAGTGTVMDLGDGRVTLQCALQKSPPPRPRVDILLALPRPKVMRRLWAPLAELGVGQIILTNAEKVERDYFDTHILHEDGYRPLLITGLQQARDTHVPRVSIHKRFKVLLEDELPALFPEGRRLMAHPDSMATIAGALRKVKTGERVLIAVGPEGGWNGFELAALDAHGFHQVSMGPRTLATTTACIALLTLVHAACSAR